MADRSKIEWTDATWNPLVGCTRVSEGCRNCYAERQAARGLPGFEGLAHFVERPDGTHEARWTGTVTERLHVVGKPLRWRRPRRIFVNSMSDLFHEAVPDTVIDRIFAIMALAPQHTFQILTKRPERMRRYLSADWASRTRMHVEWETLPVLSEHAAAAQDGLRRYSADTGLPMPLPNVWFGVSVEDQPTADERRDSLKVLSVDGWHTFVSYEPALSLVIWAGWEFVEWLVSGGESGPNARPSHPDWHRGAREFCAAYGIAYLFKQWGEWVPQLGSVELADDPEQSRYRWAEWTDWKTGACQWEYTDHPQWCDNMDPDHCMIQVGKRAAGRLLDGVEHNGMPGGAT